VKIKNSKTGLRGLDLRGEVKEWDGRLLEI
jgi:hypothetical protein